MAIDLIGESSMGHVPSILRIGPFVAGSAGYGWIIYSYGPCSSMETIAMFKQRVDVVGSFIGSVGWLFEAESHEF